MSDQHAELRARIRHVLWEQLRDALVGRGVEDADDVATELFNLADLYGDIVRLEQEKIEALERLKNDGPAGNSLRG